MQADVLSYANMQILLRMFQKNPALLFEVLYISKKICSSWRDSYLFLVGWLVGWFIGWFVCLFIGSFVGLLICLFYCVVFLNYLNKLNNLHLSISQINSASCCRFRMLLLQICNVIVLQTGIFWYTLCRYCMSEWFCGCEVLSKMQFLCCFQWRLHCKAREAGGIFSVYISLPVNF